MARLIIQVPRDGALERGLRSEPPAGDVVVEGGPTDAEGNLEPHDVGQVVLSVPSPEALEREADEVERVIAGAGAGDVPLIVEVEAGEYLRDAELAPVLDAAGRTERAVILRVLRPA